MRWLVPIALLAACASSPHLITVREPTLQSGGQTGVIRGLVTSRDGTAPLANVTVFASTQVGDILVERETLSKSDGGFKLELLPPGTYSLRFTVGTTTAYQHNIAVAAGAFTEVTARLATGP